MNTKWQALVGCVVRMKDNLEEIEISPDPGMLGKVVSVKDDGNDLMRLAIDFGQYMEHNKKVAKATFFDSAGAASLTWFETKHWPKDGIETIYANDKDIESDTTMFFEVVNRDNQTIMPMFTRVEAEALLFHLDEQTCTEGPLDTIRSKIKKELDSLK